MPLDALDAIHGRRSVGRLDEPAPRGDDLDAILAAAAAAPDHGELRPFRFVVLDGDAKDAFGAVLERAYLLRCERAGTEPDPAAREKERTKLDRAPLVLVVAAVRQPSEKIPWEEQLAASAAAAQNALIAATALGYGSMWRTGDVARDPVVKAALGLGEDDAVVGFLYLGTGEPIAAKAARPRSPDGLVRFWQPT